MPTIGAPPWRQPIVALPLLVVFLLVVGEFYPFSDFPMYSDPDPGVTDYIYLGNADALEDDGKPTPIPMQDLVGVRAAKAKKIFHTDLEEYAKSLGKKKPDLSEAERQSVAAKTLAYLRSQETRMGTAQMLPERLALVHGEIDLVLGEGIRETQTVLATE